jgi:beta-phosphoglucomutase-like phosphatase (HAD superfamily)
MKNSNQKRLQLIPKTKKNFNVIDNFCVTSYIYSAMSTPIHIPGIGIVKEEYINDFDEEFTGGDGLWQKGKDGVKKILVPHDRKCEFIVFETKTIVYVRSAMGQPAMYPLPPARFSPPAEAVLMDLDGTSVKSESFWIWAIEQTTARLLGNSNFRFHSSDMPFVSGHSVSEHLKYCINKYVPGASLEEARKYYFEIVREELAKLNKGAGRTEFFTPAPGLKEFLLTLKQHNIKIALVTSGLYEKAWPEIKTAFDKLGLGNPLDFYDAIITAGFTFSSQHPGTLGELEPKPHPWLYAEAARIGLKLDSSRNNRIIGIEDSGAGVVAIRLAGYSVIGISGGNIKTSGLRSLLHAECESLLDCLPIILGSK